MIPLKIYLKNFLSYGAPGQTINFEPHHLICLSGKNGHGKSALLDALTWVLWGQARKTTHPGKADENLIKIGQTDMTVMLDFMCNNTLYRVRREVAQSRGKLISQLDVGIIDQTTQQLKALTEKTIRDTQELINRIIGLNGEAFQNSSFFRQGNADEFSKKAPKDRKDILANLIGLDHIEQLRKRIIEKGRELGFHRQHKERLCEHIKEEVQQHTQLGEALTTLSSRIEDLTQHEKDFDTNIAIISEQQQLIATEYHALNNKRRESERIAQTIKTHYDMLLPALAKWRTIRQMKRTYKSLPSFDQRRADLIQLRHTVQEILTEEATLKTALQKYNAVLIERTYTLHREYESRLMLHKDLLQTVTTQLYAKTHAHEIIQKSSTELQHELNSINDKMTKLTEQIDLAQKNVPVIAQHLFEKNTQRLVQFQAHMTRLLHDEKMIIDHEQMMRNNQDRSCSWCFQHISEDNAQLIHQKIAHRFCCIKKHQKKLTRCIDHITECINQHHQQVLTANHINHEIQKYSSTLEALSITRDKTYHDIQQKTAQIQQLTNEISLLSDQQKALHTEQSIIEEEQKSTLLHNKQIKEINEHIGSHEYRLKTLPQLPAQLTDIQQHLDQLAAEEIHYATLQTEPELIAHLKMLFTTLRNIKQQKKIQEQELGAYATVEARFKEYEQMKLDLQQNYKKVRQEREELIHRKGSLEQACLHVEKQKEQLTHEQKELDALVAEIDDHNLLAQALSKDGLQGILIEYILPDIEREANLLLSKLTDNQTQLYFESVRELKNGNLKETLDIKISDNQGIRPYELFSGGEAFRIDFALRLAISKFLARRSGASIQTLIIDEGFGSQDEEGLNRIMEALYAIQNEFAKIIIVSHLSSMKDQFPVHFHVQKGTKGSFVQVIQQG